MNGVSVASVAAADDWDEVELDSRPSSATATATAHPPSPSSRRDLLHRIVPKASSRRSSPNGDVPGMMEAPTSRPNGHISKSPSPSSSSSSANGRHLQRTSPGATVGTADVYQSSPPHSSRTIKGLLRRMEEIGRGELDREIARGHPSRSPSRHPHSHSEHAHHHHHHHHDHHRQSPRRRRSRSLSVSDSEDDFSPTTAPATPRRKGSFTQEFEPIETSTPRGALTNRPSPSSRFSTKASPLLGRSRLNDQSSSTSTLQRRLDMARRSPPIGVSAQQEGMEEDDDDERDGRHGGSLRKVRFFKEGELGSESDRGDNDVDENDWPDAPNGARSANKLRPTLGSASPRSHDGSAGSAPRNEPSSPITSSITIPQRTPRRYRSITPARRRERMPGGASVILQDYSDLGSPFLREKGRGVRRDGVGDDDKNEIGSDDKEVSAAGPNAADEESLSRAIPRGQQDLADLVAEMTAEAGDDSLQISLKQLAELLSYKSASSPQAASAQGADADSLSTALAAQRNRSATSQSELLGAITELKAREGADNGSVSQLTKLEQKAKQEEEQHRRLGDAVEELRRRVDGLMGGVGDRLSILVEEGIKHQERRTRTWMVLVVCFELLLVYLMFMFANSRANALFQSVYFDPFNPLHSLPGGFTPVFPTSSLFPVSYDYIGYSGRSHRSHSVLAALTRWLPSSARLASRTYVTEAAGNSGRGARVVSAAVLLLRQSADALVDWFARLGLDDDFGHGTGSGTPWSDVGRVTIPT